jgi:hypothetical protein
MVTAAALEQFRALIASGNHAAAGQFAASGGWS